MRQIVLCCLLLALVTRITVHAQNTGFNTADTLAMQFVKSIRNIDKEKVLLQTDRKVYVAGERLWFKAFLLHTINNHLDTASHNLFVDLVNDSDKVIKQLVLNVLSLRTDGAITLGDTLATGYYWLRGYTQNMLQSDSSAICVQPLYIKNLGGGNDFNINERQRPRGSAKGIVQYFPEGGALIAGINSTGALKVTDGSGNPLQATGTIVDAADSIVSTFTTNRFGLARITFYPAWFKKYYASININGQQIKQQLAEWSPFSAQIAVTRQSDEYIQAYVTLEDSIYTRKFSTYVLGISKDSVCFAGVGRGMYQVDVPTANFPGGVATLLLFDGNQRLLSERKVFINKDNYKITVTPDKPNYIARDKAHVSFEVTGTDGKPLVASLNVSVQDDRIMRMSDEIKSDTIQPFEPYELNDWLKQNRGSFSAADIDLFMLAQKPVYQNWADAKNLLPKQTNADKTDLLVNLKGTVVNRHDQPLKQKIVAAISVSGLNPYIGIDTTNDGGAFTLPLPLNRDSLLLKVEVKNRHDMNEDDNIVVNNFSFPQFATPASLKHVYAAGKQVFAQRLAKYHVDTVFIGTGKEWLNPVIVRSTIRPKSTTDYDQSKRLSTTSYIMSGDKLGEGGYGQISNAMLMVPGMSLKGGQLVLYGGRGMSNASGDDKIEPMVVMDGIRLPKSTLDQTLPGSANGSTVLSFLNGLDPRSIDFIEVLNGADAAIYGADGGNGVIVINTKTKPTDKSIPPAFRIIQPLTYHKAPKFVVPDYAMKTVKNSKTPDPRVTIYWNSNVLTGVDGKAAVEFYTADEASTYSVVVSGLTASGEYVYKRITLNRK